MTSVVEGQSIDLTEADPRAAFRDLTVDQVFEVCMHFSATHYVWQEAGFLAVFPPIPSFAARLPADVRSLAPRAGAT